MTNYTLCIGGFRVKTPNAQQGFCVRRAEVQNSTVVFQLNFSNNIGFCASISRPNAKPQNVSKQLIQNRLKRKKDFEVHQQNLSSLVAYGLLHRNSD